jgi:hypothetical protein
MFKQITNRRGEGPGSPGALVLSRLCPAGVRWAA